MRLDLAQVQIQNYKYNNNNSQLSFARITCEYVSIRPVVGALEETEMSAAHAPVIFARGDAFVAVATTHVRLVIRAVGVHPGVAVLAVHLPPTAATERGLPPITRPTHALEAFCPTQRLLYCLQLGDVSVYRTRTLALASTQPGANARRRIHSRM